MADLPGHLGPRSVCQALGQDSEEPGPQLGSVSRDGPTLCLRGLGRCAMSQSVTQVTAESDPSSSGHRYRKFKVKVRPCKP